MPEPVAIPLWRPFERRALLLGLIILLTALVMLHQLRRAGQLRAEAEGDQTPEGSTSD